jgi:hypothetical protein
VAATKEKLVKQRVVAQLKELGAYYFYPVSGGFATSGVPDIVCCYQGRFIGIECKAGKGKTTALQDKNLAAIAAAGGLAMVVNEENVEQVTDLLKSY